MSTLLLPLCPSTSPHLCRTIAAISIAIAVAIHSITSTCKADCCREQSLALSFVLVAARCCHLAFSVFLALSCYCPLIIALPWLKAIASWIEREGIHQVFKAQRQRGRLLTTTSLRQEQQQRVLATVAANYIFGWLVVWLVGCCLSIRSEREQSSYGIDCILKPSFIWCHLVLQVVDSLSWVERETTLSPCLLCVSGPFLLLSVDNCTSSVWRRLLRE